MIVDVNRETVSIMRACARLGVSRRTVYNWIAAGKVEYVRTPGGSVRIFVDTLYRGPDRRRIDMGALVQPGGPDQ